MSNSFKKKIIIKSKSYDSVILDKYILSILRLVNNQGGYVIGPVPLAITDNRFIIDASKNINRDDRLSKPREQHKRLLYVFDESDGCDLDSQINDLPMPNGVGVEIKSQE